VNTAPAFDALLVTTATPEWRGLFAWHAVFDGRFVEMESGCWEWTGSRNRGGYDTLSNGKRGVRQLAHRVSLGITLGRHLGRDESLHTCDNPPCIRPGHLFPGSNADNRADMIAKGRAAIGDRNGARRHPDRVSAGLLRSGAHRGEGNGRAKLTADTVRAIRRRRTAGEALDTLAVEFGVSDVAIAYVALGRTWGHVR
jgi:hypothetical protein